MSIIVLLPVFGAFLESALSIVDKKIINSKIKFPNYIVYIFLSIAIVSLPLMFFFWNVKSGALELKNLIIFIVIIVSSVFANFFVFYSLTREDLLEVEPIRLTLPLFSILIAFIFSFFFEVYSNERNYSIIALSLIASITLIASHVKKNHIYFNKYAVAAIIGSFLFAFELVISKQLLAYYNPITFYFLRSLIIFVIVFSIFSRKLTWVKNKVKIMMLLLALIAVLERVILYYGYQNLGIIFTTTLFILAPVFIYIFAWIFLKEKITTKQIISSIVIVVCVITAIVIGR